MNTLKLHKFADGNFLGEELASRICEALAAAIKTRGSAVLAVSGGSTPKNLFKILSAKTIPWKHVIVTLVDERWVGEEDERSNARLVKNDLLVDRAASAGFVPLYTGEPDIVEAMSGLEGRLQKLPLPFDAVILGMGTDGHTASFFPGGDNLIAAVDPATKDRVISMRAQGAGEPRVTFTLPILAGAGFLALHIEGEDKLAVLDQAANDSNISANISANAMPVRHIIRAAQQLEIYWAP